MKLYFITSNKNKFEEMKHHVQGLEQLDIDLPEIQSLELKDIVDFKIEEALKRHSGPLIVEDTALYCDSLGNLPGPLIKWFLRAFSKQKFYELVASLGSTKAEVRCLIGFARTKDKIEFFEGKVAGQIVAPRGESGHGWDPIFQPDGSDKTYAEISPEEKDAISHRGIAVRKLKEYLDANRI